MQGFSHRNSSKFACMDKKECKNCKHLNINISPSTYCHQYTDSEGTKCTNEKCRGKYKNVNITTLKRFSKHTWLDLSTLSPATSSMWQGALLWSNTTLIKQITNDMIKRNLYIYIVEIWQTWISACEEHLSIEWHGHLLQLALHEIYQNGWGSMHAIPKEL